MEKIKKIIFIVAIIGIISVILFLGGNILKTIIDSKNDEKELKAAYNIMLGTWVCEKSNGENICIKTLKIYNKTKFTFDFIEKYNDKIQRQYTITGNCYVKDYKNKLYNTYIFDRKNYKNIINAPEKEYNWKEYMDKDVPTAIIENDKLILFGDSYIKKENNNNYNV